MNSRVIPTVTFFMVLYVKAQAAFIVWPAVEMEVITGSTYAIGTDIAADVAGGASVFFDAQEINPLQLMLTAQGASVAVGHFWYPTAFGAPVGMTTANQTIPFAHNFPDSYGELTPVNLYRNQVFYLGFWLDVDWSGAPSATTDIYGWAALLWDGTELTLVDSAAETTGVGIYAGTYDAIPEPSMSGLLLAGLAVLAVRRRHTRRPSG